MQTFYKWKHLSSDTTFRCEFNLKDVFSKGFNASTVYIEDQHACNLKAEYQVSDDIQDYWVCRKHLSALYPTVSKEVIGEEGDTQYSKAKYLRHMLRNDK